MNNHIWWITFYLGFIVFILTLIKLGNLKVRLVALCHNIKQGLCHCQAKGFDRSDCSLWISNPRPRLGQFVSSPKEPPGTPCEKFKPQRTGMCSA